MHFWKINSKAGLKLVTNNWKKNCWLIGWKQFSIFDVTRRIEKISNFRSKILNCIPKQCNEYCIVENETLQWYLDANTIENTY